LKKRSKKLLLLKARFGGKSATATKSFLLLFFKKEVLSWCPAKKQKRQGPSETGYP
jgi:hypothetical protein